MLNANKKQKVQRKVQKKSTSNYIEEEWTFIKETLTTSVQHIRGERQNERNEE